MELISLAVRYAVSLSFPISQVPFERRVISHRFVKHGLLVVHRFEFSYTVGFDFTR